ncbi:thiol:disulfide interchange protein TlpA [Lutibaculum baratangense]|uniref:Thiol:disulfide oxidoreductase TlpA n=1 Tax=Lutibaculum baratangense AMV1 TaxID=631454 RepID=V4RFL5_9HYPH|nr:TlpA disulfide reductase family protein [Lutibaculum baratangense]ESR24179.1 Thiol:disulfide oxidoreductase TlpA [Lutibaculum baratangense AMV1]
MSSDGTPTETKAAPRRRTTMLAGGALAVVLGAAAVYGIGFATGNGEAAACAADPATLAALGERARGEVAAVIVPDAPDPLPEMRFSDEDGSERALSEWKGKVVLLNLWATWCVPCREEMPALDTLQAELGGQDFEVVAVNLDRGDAEKPRKFLAETGIEHLALYRDPGNEIFSTLKSRGRAFGLPTTLLVDAEGCEIGHLPGPADWASGDALDLVRAALGRPDQGG